MIKPKISHLVMSTMAILVGGMGLAHADERVSLYLKWIPQYQFAGYLVAKYNGYYKKEGLDVKIIPGGPNINTVQEVADGAAEFGIQTPDTTIPTSRNLRRRKKVLYDSYAIVLVKSFTHPLPSVLTSIAIGSTDSIRSERNLSRLSVSPGVLVSRVIV